MGIGLTKPRHVSFLDFITSAVRQEQRIQGLVLMSEVKSFIMKCDLCTDDDGKGIHYHAFIEGKHHWVCESCKKKLKIDAEHTDD